MGKKIEGEKKKLVMIWCEVCNIVMYFENVMEIYKFGKKYKVMFKKYYFEQLLEIYRFEKRVFIVIVKFLDVDLSEEELKVYFLEKVFSQLIQLLILLQFQ